MDALKELFKNFTPEQLDLPEGHLDRFEGRIEKELQRKKFFFRINTSVAVAGIILMFLLPFLFIKETQEKQLILSSTDEETVESEFYLRSEIESRMQIIDTIEASKINNLSLISDINDLDESLINLQVDLRESPNDQRIINAVINTYRLKLQALDNILTILQKYS